MKYDIDIRNDVDFHYLSCEEVDSWTQLKEASESSLGCGGVIVRYGSKTTTTAVSRPISPMQQLTIIRREEKKRNSGHTPHAIDYEVCTDLGHASSIVYVNVRNACLTIRCSYLNLKSPL